MTDSTLLKQFGDKVDLTLVEDCKSGVIGVGESTTNFFNSFLKFMDIKDKDFISTFKRRYL